MRVAGLVLASTVALGQLAANGIAEEAADVNGVEWLFIQTADRSTFDGETLRLEGVNANTIAFADRPQRMATHVATGELIGTWDDGADSFAGDPPNAGLSVVVDGALRTATVELFDPSLDGDALSYRVRVIEGTVPVAGGPASLFIDGRSTPGRGFDASGGVTPHEWSSP